MKAWITYDRYENNEWFHVYQFTSKWNDVKRDYKKNLIDFISYGPDDCHSYQIQELDIKKEEYDYINKIIVGHTDDHDDGEFDNVMEQIWNDCDWNTNCLLATDGDSDFYDCVRYYCEKNDIDPDDDDAYYEAQELLASDEDLMAKTLEEYIDATYEI